MSESDSKTKIPYWQASQDLESDRKPQLRDRIDYSERSQLSTTSLEQLEADYWGEAPQNAPRLVKVCYGLRKKPINSLDTEEIRVLISQDIGLNYLIPLAIKNLEQDILVEGDFYPGDLLMAVLKIDRKYWHSLNSEREELDKIIQNQRKKLELASINQEIRDELKQALNNFQK